VEIGDKRNMKIENRIVQLHLMYPDTECFVEKETEEEIVYRVVIKK